MKQEPIENENLNQEAHKAIADSPVKGEKRPYQAPAVVEFTPSVWAVSAF
jgi:hypothetical protein